MSITLRLMERKDWDEVAQLIHASLNTWYKKNRGFELVGGPWETMRVFPRVYESLDPNCCILAVDSESRRIAGSCFFHPRPTHVSFGIMNVHPDFFGRKAAVLMLQYILDFAAKENKPVRMVSNAMNLDSFSLYNKAGFKPTGMFQEMVLKVPEEGVPCHCPKGCIIRDARIDDVPEMVALEMELYGIHREKDFRYFIENEQRIWHTSVLIDESGKIAGFLNSINDLGSNMLGPGIARTEAQATGLLCAELNQHKGRTPAWIVPSCASETLKALYSLGAKNFEINVSQVYGTAQPATGIVMPTFMPETS
ncbi:MAG: GNAT family N-acetyltransferase [Planctomycetaceae bacterium]|nr:GNAT family N-acetyltransferase [Planctomycetaceae bacterium]